MCKLIFIVSSLFILGFPLLTVNAQETTTTPDSQVTILSPKAGQALQGTTLIVGEINTPDALSVELGFSYSENPRETWFLIHEIEGDVPQELNLEWDTTTLTDGEYTLRLIVNTDQDQLTAFVPGLRVRNYSAIETSTPSPSSTPAPAETLSPIETPILTNTPVPITATPLPPNPAQLTQSDITTSIAKGALATLGLFGVLGIYHYVRNRSRRKD